MSDLDGSDDSSSDHSQPEVKRRLTDTASYTSHSSAQQESDDDNELNTTNFGYSAAKSRLIRYKEGSPEVQRLSSSSFSENCSSPGEDCRPTFESNDKPTDEPNAMDTVYSSTYGPSAMRMMNKMGYKPGKGLGKHETGRSEPVQASTQKGYRGLGLGPSMVGEVPADFKWSPDDTKPEAKETVEWMPTSPDEEITADILDDWLVKGDKKEIIDDETHFCDEHILKGVLSAKNVFDTLDSEELRKARYRSNPYEKIGAVFFLNRAGVKMANMDAVFEFMFTNPVDQRGQSLLKNGDLLYFADVCAGPGGFSEYVLYRKKWKAKGFGFTLRGANDFKLSEFYAGSPETFTPYYGPRDNGDIMDPENLQALRDHVLKQTDGNGVHFLMADGGFSVDGRENIQEILSKNLYLCQCLAALMLVRTGGHFVVKLFDVFTPFSVSLVYLMYRCFDKVCIHKPVTSRPANSERYLICKWKRAGVDAVERHLFSVNEYLNSHKDRDVTSLVPIDVLKEDKQFYRYVYTSNCVLGERQIKNLLKIKQFCEDETLREDTQDSIRTECLKRWNLPDDVRKQPQRLTHDETLSEIINNMKHRPVESSNLRAFKENLMARPVHADNWTDLRRQFMNLYDWYFQFLSSTRENNDCKFYLGTGNKVFELRDTLWRIQEDVHINLPAKTLIYAEVVREYIGEGGAQRHSRALHVIDAVSLGGVDISHRTLTERIQECEIFCRALSKPVTMFTPIRCKKLLTLESFPSSMHRLTFRKMKTGRQGLTIDIQSRTDSEKRFHLVSAVVFFKEIKEPWGSSISKRSKQKYYFKMLSDNKCSDGVNELPEKGVMDVLSSLRKRIEWYWEPPSAVYQGTKQEGVKREEIESLVHTKSIRLGK